MSIGPEMDVTITEVCSLPPDCVADAITSDGHVIAFCQEPDGSLRFLWDGEAAGPPFEALDVDQDEAPWVYASDDGAHVAYVGLRGDEMFVGRDGREEPGYHWVSPSVPPVFGGGGRHLVYGAEVRGDDLMLILDGQPVESEALAPIAATFSPDGERLAFAEMRHHDRKEPEYRIVVDGRASGWLAAVSETVGAMQFSPDGRRFAYYAFHRSGDARWVVDGVGQRALLDERPVDPDTLQPIGVGATPLFAGFSPDSHRFAYAAHVEGGVAVIEDDIVGPAFEAVGHPVFSPDSLSLAYSAQTVAQTVALVVDGKITGEWPATGSGDPTFSSDSRRIALALQREDGRFLNKRRHFAVAVDGHAYPEELGEDASIYPTFSPDGSRIAWWLRRGADRRLVIDGVLQGHGPAIDSEIRFDASGRLVHAVLDGTRCTVSVDGRPGPLADEVAELFPVSEVFRHQPERRASVPFRLSDDGTHVAWAGVFGDDTRPVLDDEVGPSFDTIHDCRFTRDGTVVWWAQRGATVLRVERPPV